MMADQDELLKDEYLALNKAVDDFDGRALTIKTWSVTASGAALATAYLQNQPIILLIAAFGALVFWFIDAHWKVNQRGHYPRIRQIESHFAAGGTKTTPFQVSKARIETNIARPKLRWTLWVMREPVCALPHFAVLLAGVVLYVLAPPDRVQEAKVSSVNVNPPTRQMLQPPGKDPPFVTPPPSATPQ